MEIPHHDERAVLTYGPRTTSIRGGRFEVRHDAPRFLPGAFDAQTLNTVSVARLMNRLATVEAQTLAQVESAVKLWFDLNHHGARESDH